MKIILLGPPGSGKGTQSEFIKKYINIKIISPGEMLRNEIKKQTTLGKKIKILQKKGNLINDKIIINLIKTQIKNHKNILFDGFPRTLTQALFLKQNNIKIHKIININIKIQNIIKRLKYRLINNKSLNIYNIIHNKPIIKNKDNINGGLLTIRNDDKFDTINTRLLIYEKKTKDIINFYKNIKSTKIINIDGNNSIKQISNIIKSKIL